VANLPRSADPPKRGLRRTVSENHTAEPIRGGPLADTRADALPVPVGGPPRGLGDAEDKPMPTRVRGLRIWVPRRKVWLEA
jgi:hypothetical protein